MASSFTCPHCGLVSEIDPAHVGKSGPCRGCGKEVTVPFPKEAALPPTASSRGSATPWIIGCAVVGVIGLGLLALLACGGIAMFSFRSQQMQIQQEMIQAEQKAQEAEVNLRKMADEVEQAGQDMEKAADELEKKATDLEEQADKAAPK